MSTCYPALKQLARFLIEKRTLFLQDWTVQGFGFMRLRISDTMRLHIWHPSLRKQGVSDIHDHQQWAFTSTVLAGEIRNQLYDVIEGPGWVKGEIVCGIGGGKTARAMEKVTLLPRAGRYYRPGASYAMTPNAVHSTQAEPGTVTVIEQTRTDTDKAFVFWPVGETWVDAEPRQATAAEVAGVGEAAIRRLGE